MNKSRHVLELFTAILYESFTHTAAMKKIGRGFIIKDVFDRLKNRILNDSSRPNRMLLYFTHGHTIVNILNSLNVYEVREENIQMPFYDYSFTV